MPSTPLRTTNHTVDPTPRSTGPAHLAPGTVGARGGRAGNALLWTVQALLAALFLFAGGTKLVMPIAALTQQSPLPGWLIRVVGVVEVLGALGLVLPGALRIRAWLTPVAAAGLAILMVGATAATLATPQQASAAPIPMVVGLVALAVAYGRRAWALPLIVPDVHVPARAS